MNHRTPKVRGGASLITSFASSRRSGRRTRRDYIVADIDTLPLLQLLSGNHVADFNAPPEKGISVASQPTIAVDSANKQITVDNASSENVSSFRQLGSLTITIDAAQELAGELAFELGAGKSELVIPLAGILSQFEDADGDVIEFDAITIQSENGTVERVGSTLVFRPTDRQFSGDTTIQIRVKAGAAKTVADLTISVLGDSEAPSVSLIPNFAKIDIEQDRPTTFTAIITDNIGVNAESFGDDNFVAVDPAGAKHALTYVSSTTNEEGHLVATYKLTAPKGGWTTELLKEFGPRRQNRWVTFGLDSSQRTSSKAVSTAVYG